MRQFTCKDCGEDHDLSDWEPSFRLPDEVFALPLSEEELAERAPHGRNWCELKGADGAASRWFVRTLLPFPVVGREEPCSWGVWVEVDAASSHEIRARWDDPAQNQAGPWRATVANDAETYPSTLGLRGSVRFTHFDRIPQLTLDAEQAHRFVAEHQHGITEARVLDWYHAFSAEGDDEDEEPESEEPPSRLLECGTHGAAHGAMVCTHLVDARDHAVGFVENSDDPEDLQAWCDACEQLFLTEGEHTPAFEEFCDVRLVCVFCYATIKERHSALLE